jgi:hypothetical protein
MAEPAAAPPARNRPAARAIRWRTRSACARTACRTSPGPDKDGAIRLDPKKGLDPNSQDFKKAQEKCKALQGGGDPVNGSGSDPWPQEMKLKYAQCMRANGILEFPDPAAGGSGDFAPFSKDGKIDPQSSQFKKADDACKQYKPSGIAPGGGPAGGGAPGGAG